MHVERRIKTLWISDFYWAKTLPIGYNSTKSWVFWPSIFVCSFLKKVHFLRELVQRSELSSNIKTTRWNRTILSALLEKNCFTDALWNLKCTQEAKVALECASNNSQASLVSFNLPACIVTHVKSIFLTPRLQVFPKLEWKIWVSKRTNWSGESFVQVKEVWLSDCRGVRKCLTFYLGLSGQRSKGRKWKN